MQNRDNMNQGPFSNMNTPPNSAQNYPTELSDMVTYRMVYPEIFYKLQPFVLMACDQMDTNGTTMPTQEMVDKMSEYIYDDICRMYPDLEDYARNCERKANANPAVVDVITQDVAPFRRNFRRRGLLRDIIDILLLSELFRRRRRNY